jgi:hypothetical protein
MAREKPEYGSPGLYSPLTFLADKDLIEFQ